MSYKVRIGDKVYKVGSLSGLISMAQAGQIQPETPIFVPRTGKWHYAKSIRQLRACFPPSAAPEPPPSPPPTSGNVSRPDFAAHARENTPAPGSAAPAPQGNVLPLRRPASRAQRSEPVEVPIYSYDLDEHTPNWLRRIVLASFVVVVGGGILLWVAVERNRYVRGNPPTGRLYTPTPTITPPPRPHYRAKRNTFRPTPGHPGAPVRPAAGSDVPTLSLRKKIRAQAASHARSLDELEDWMSLTLARARVPVRSVKIVAPRGKRGQQIAYNVIVVYPQDKKTGDERRVAIGMVVGRAMIDQRLNVGALVLKGHRKGKIVRTQRVAGKHCRDVYTAADATEFLAELHK